MVKLFFVLILIIVFASIVDCYYVRPIVTRTLIQTCGCGFIVPECGCNNVFHSGEFTCGLMNIYYTPTTYPECSQAYVTCTKQGATFQSMGIVGKVIEKDGSGESYSLLGERKLTVNHQVLTCKDGSWIREDMEGNQFINPLTIQCASSDAADAFDYYVTNT